MGHDPPYTTNDKPPGLRHGGHRFRVVSEVGLEQPLTLELFPGELALTADSLGLLARFFLGRFLEMLLKLHFTEHAFALQLFFRARRA